MHIQFTHFIEQQAIVHLFEVVFMLLIDAAQERIQRFLFCLLRSRRNEQVELVQFS